MAVAGLGLAASLGACGGGGDSDFADQSGEEIADASQEAMKDLDAVKVSGAVTTQGQEVEMDVRANADGDCSGSIGAGGGTAELLGVGDRLWFKPDEAFWRATAGENAEQILTIVGDRWVVVPDRDSAFNDFCDLDELIDEVTGSDDEATFTKGDTEDVDGDEVILLERESDEDGTSTSYVLVDEPHYVVKIERAEGDDTGAVSFSEFDAEFDVEAPGADEVVDFDKLAG